MQRKPFQMTDNELIQLRESMRLRSGAVARQLGLSASEYEAMEEGHTPIPPAVGMAMTYMSEHPEARPRMAPEDIREVNADELFDSLSSNLLRDGKEWGPWRFSIDSMTLDFNSREVAVDRVDGQDVMERREDYYVELSRALDAKDVLDWLGQINGKGWGPAALGYLAEALDEILHFQGNLVHSDGYASADALFERIRARLDSSPARD